MIQVMRRPLSTVSFPLQLTTELDMHTNGHNFLSQWIRKLGVHDLSILEVDREGSRRCRVSFVDTKTNDAHGSHCHDIEPCDFKPLPKTRSSIHIHNDRAPLLAMARRRCRCRCICGSSTVLTAAEKTHDFSLLNSSFQLQNDESDLRTEYRTSKS